MLDPTEYAHISVAAIKALTRHESVEFEVFLPGSCGEDPVLYRRAGAGLSEPDFERMAETGVSHVYVRAEDYHECEKVLEAKLTDILTSPAVDPADKVQIVHSAGTSVVRDLMHGPMPSSELKRASKVVDSMIGCVLTDPLIAGCLLQMARHEQTTASHMLIVSALAVAMGADVYGPDHEMLKALGFAGMLHDMGKLSIPTEVLSKSAPLTRAESELIQQHPIESVRLIADDPNATPLVRKMILQHHERLDGNGYPVGVKGGDLLPGSRLLSIVDSFHAMIGRRTYRAPLTPAEANRVLSTQANRQFDPDLLASWIALCENHELDQTYITQPIEPVVPGQAAGEGSSVRHEHRPIPPPPKIVTHRRPRFECRGTTMVHCVYVGRVDEANTAPDEFSALVHDVSRAGLSIYAAHPMYRGEVVNLRIDQGEQCMWLHSRVAWCRQENANVFRIGFRFIKHIPEGQARVAAPVDPMDGCGPAAKPPASAVSAETNTTSAATEQTPVREKCKSAMKTLAAIALMRNVSAEGQRTAVTLAMSSNAAVRLKGVDVLMNLGTRIARDALVALLDDKNAEVRERAVVAVGALKIIEANGGLRRLLHDSVDRVALRAAGALGRIGDKCGLPLVARVLESDGPDVRLAALAFGDITGHHFGASREGVKAARRYLSAKSLAKV